MNKKNIAVCFYGLPESIDRVKRAKDLVLEKFANDYDLFFFECFSNGNQFTNLRTVAFHKRSQEIERGDLFDICLAVHVDHIELLNNLFFKDIDLNTLYFVKGVYQSYTLGTAIFPWMFYCHSLIFDRACDFEHNTIPPLTRSLEHRFYYHLKTLVIDTECINVNDPELFKVID